MSNGALADAARHRFDQAIVDGRARTAQALAAIEAQVPRDYLVPLNAIGFKAKDGVLHMGSKTDWSVHPHALRQLSDKLGIPQKYTSFLAGQGWGSELLAHNFEALKKHVPAEKFLVRAVDQEVRAVLSDSYRPMDSGLIVDAFSKVCEDHNAAVVNFHVTDTKWYVQVLAAEVYEPIEGEVVAMGVSLHHSDFGDGALAVKAFMMRLICLNGATTKDYFRQVHLGRRLQSASFSRETMQLDSRTIASAVRDVTQKALDKGEVEVLMDGIREAASTTADPVKAFAKLRDRGDLSKGDEEELRDLYVSADIEELPPGNTMWRVSQAVSRLASIRADSGEAARAAELQQLSGNMLLKGGN